MGERFQVYLANVDMARAFRQFQKADKAYANDNDDATERHLQRGLELLEKVVDHLVNAVDADYEQAANEFDKGNKELQKSLDAYDDDNNDQGDSHYEKALEHYDKALDLIV